jgi:hypothetical protein
MNPTMILFIEFAMIGVVYFLLYRFLFNQVFKWKMIHSIWLPLLVSVFSIVLAIIMFTSKDQTGWNDLAAIATLMVFNFPVLGFFISFGIDALITNKKSAKK